MQMSGEDISRRGAQTGSEQLAALGQERGAAVARL
jgi:hypothetical protein